MTIRRSTGNRLPLFLVLLLGLILGAQKAHAHRIRIFAALNGDSINGRAYVSAKQGIAGQTIQVLALDGTTLGSTTTDGEGRFVFRPTKQVDHRFVLNIGDGHCAEYTVRIQATSSQAAGAVLSPPAQKASAPTSVSTSQDEEYKKLSQEIFLLREQLDEYQNRIRLQDVIGGLGYILGIAGVVAWLKSKKSTP